MTWNHQPPISTSDPQKARALAAKGQTVTTLSLHHLSKRGTGELLCKGVCLKMQYTPEMDSAVDLVVPHFRETQLDRHFTSVLRHSHLHLNPGSMDGKSLKRTLRSSIIQRTSRTAVNFKPNSWSRHVWLLNPAIDFEAAKHSHRLGEWRKWHSSHRPSTAADMVAGGRAWQGHRHGIRLWFQLSSLSQPITMLPSTSPQGESTLARLVDLLPSGYVNSLLLKMAIYSGFTHEKWWFSIVMLVSSSTHSKASSRFSAKCPFSSALTRAALCRKISRCVNRILPQQDMFFYTRVL